MSTPYQDPIAFELGGCHDYEDDTAEDVFERVEFNPPAVKGAQVIGRSALLDALND